MAKSTAKGNREIILRFEAEQIDHGHWPDSEASEGEAGDVVPDLALIKAVAGKGLKTPPVHVIFAIDASRSMNRCDANGMRRLDAVLQAGAAFISDQKAQGFTSEDRYSLITFNNTAEVWSTRCNAEDAILHFRNGMCLAAGEGFFQVAFQAIRHLLRHGEQSQVIFLSDGAPSEKTGLNKLSAQSKVLDSMVEILGSKGPKVHTVGFGTNRKDFEIFLRPMAEMTGGTFSCSSLSSLSLAHTLTSLGSSITSGRVLVSPAAPQEVPQRKFQSFESDISTAECVRICDIYNVTRIGNVGKARWGQVSRFRRGEKARGAPCSIASQAFASGGMRLVYKMEDESVLNRDTPMVAKRLIKKEHATEDEMSPFCNNTSLAISFRDSFADCCRQAGVTIRKMIFVPCYLYTYKYNGICASFVGEQMLEGEFIKYNSNNGWWNTAQEHSEISELMQAFSHFTFVRSKYQCMVVDLQGVVNAEDGTLLLTDPQAHSKYRTEDGYSDYGSGDFGSEGFVKFFHGHRCGPTCKALKLMEKMDSVLAALPGHAWANSQGLAPCDEDYCCLAVNRAKQQIKNKYVSSPVYDQQGGTCYAHAVATVVRAVEKSIPGRNVEDHGALVSQIVSRHGSNGGNCVRVLDEECPHRALKHRLIGSSEVSAILVRGTPVLVCFRFTDDQWAQFSLHFRRTPKASLAEVRSGGGRHTSGHAAVITKSKTTERGETWYVKNSWGVDFADEGIFKVRRQAFDQLPPQCATYVEVYFEREDLFPQDEINRNDRFGQLLGARLSPTPLRSAPGQRPRSFLSNRLW